MPILNMIYWATWWGGGWGWGTITWFSYDNKTLSVPQSTYGDVNGMVFSADGTKFYMTWEAKNTVYQFSLSTAWDISTGSYDNKSKSVVSQTSNVTASIIFSDDGTTMYIWWWWATWYLFQYTLSTAWDVSTASYDSVQSNISFNETVSYKIYNNWTYVYSLDRSNRTIYRYTMATPQDITSLWNQQSFVLPANWVNNWYHEVVINSQGNQMFVLDRDLKQILIYSLSTAWDITTAILDDTYTIPTPNSSNITSMVIDNGWQNMYLWWWQLNNIYQYSTTTV